MFDWNNMEDEFKGDFKPYAPDGSYEVVLDKVEKKEASTGTVFFEFFFKDTDEYQYPKVSRAFFRDEKKKFRAFHYRNIMMVLGASKENAQKAVEACEGKGSKENITEAYTQTFNRLAQKHPKIKLEVTTDDAANGKQYARGEFADPTVHFSNKKKTTDVLSTGEDASDTIDVAEIPFI